MSLLSPLVRQGNEQRAINLPPGAYDADWSNHVGNSGHAGGAAKSLQLLTVYGCVRFICDGISTLPVDQLRRRPDGSPQHLTPDPLLLEPAKGLDFTAWATQFLSSLLLVGNFYGLKRWEGTKVAGVLPLDPTEVTVRREGGQLVYVVNGEKFNRYDIMHVPGIMWAGADTGLSPVKAAEMTIKSASSAVEYGSRFLEQDSTPGGVIEVPGELQPEKTRQMARDWARAHSGPAKRGLPGVLQGGATWKQLSIPNDQAQFLETRQFTAAEIAAQMFLIDPPEIGIGVQGQSLTYSNLEQRNARKVQVTFLPWIIRLEKALTSCLAPGDYVKVNVNGLLRADTKSRMEAHKVAIDAGIETIDEARGLEERAPLPSMAPAPPSLTEQIEAVGQLIRAGFEPGASLSFLGLPPIAHTGLVPITVTDDTAKPAPAPGGAP